MSFAQCNVITVPKPKNHSKFSQRGTFYIGTPKPLMVIFSTIEKNRTVLIPQAVELTKITGAIWYNNL